VPPESAKGKLGKTTARGFDMVYQIYEGYKQIIKLDYDTMPRAQYAAAVSKIVARLASDYGLFWVGSILGAFTAGLFTGGNPLGAIGGFIAGGTGGIAASYLLGDSVGAITDAIVDSVYGTDKTPAPAPQQNKPTPAEVAENKAYLEGMAAWIAAGGIPTDPDKKEMDAARLVLKAAGVAIAPAPQAAEKVPAPAADPVAEVAAEFQSIVTELDKIYADQTPLPGETGKTELAKITALIAKSEALMDKIAKLPPDQRAPELVNAANSMNKKIHAATMAVGHRILLQDTDPAVYAKLKAGADKLIAFAAEVNYLDVKDPDFEKKARALALQVDQMIESLPDVPEGDRGAYEVRKQSMTTVRDVMVQKQKEYQDYRAKNPAPVTGGFKEGQTGMIDGKKVIFKNGKWVYQ
jgi:hypothetical protein